MKSDKKVKHSKYKNTGLLFELLVRQITVDALNGSQDSTAIKLIKKYFNTNSKPLAKELNLYKGLMETKFSSENRATEFIEETLISRTKMSALTLKKEKYNLVKDIKEYYDLEEFFRSKLGTYKELASIYKLFESAADKTSEFAPAEKVQCRQTLIERISGTAKVTKKTDDTENDKLFEEYRKQSDELKELAYRSMVKNFNEKYSSLDTRQKTLLREFIYNVSNTNSFREYVNTEVDVVKEELNQLVSKIKDSATKIKVEGIAEHIDRIKNGKVVKDTQLLQLMKYYELVKEIKSVTATPKVEKK